MDPRPPTPEIEALLTEMSWVRNLVGSLIRGDADRADLEQETWLNASRRGSGITHPRGWLAIVARGLARNAGRARDRRREIERSADSPEPAPDPAELVAAAELQRDLVTRVLALSVPERTLLLQHYFAGRSLREIAAASGENAATVRSRHRRALLELRQRLDAAHGETRWRKAWLPLLPREVASSAAVFAVSGFLAATIGAALLVVITVTLFTRRDVPVVEPSNSNASLSTTVAAAIRSVESIQDDHPVSGTVREPPVAAAMVSAGRFLSGFVFDPSGAPLPGASLRLAIGEHLFLAEPIGEVVVSASDGSFVFEKAPAGPSPDVVLVDRAPFARLAEKIDDREQLEIRLEPGSRVSGTVWWSGKERAVSGATLRVHFHEQKRAHGMVVVTDASGRFVLDGVPRDAEIIAFVRPENGSFEQRTFVCGTPEVSLDIELEPRTIVKGRVVALATQSPIRDAVFIWEAGFLAGTALAGNGLEIGRSDVLGEFELAIDAAAVERCELRLMARAEGHATTTITYPRGALDDQPIVFPMLEGLRIEGRVLVDAKSDDGARSREPTRGIVRGSFERTQEDRAKRAVPIFGIARSECRLDGSGRFELDGVPPNVSVVLTASRSDPAQQVSAKVEVGEVSINGIEIVFADATKPVRGIIESPADPPRVTSILRGRVIRSFDSSKAIELVVRDDRDSICARIEPTESGAFEVEVAAETGTPLKIGQRTGYETTIATALAGASNVEVALLPRGELRVLCVDAETGRRVEPRSIEVRRFGQSAFVKLDPGVIRRMEDGAVSFAIHALDGEVGISTRVDGLLGARTTFRAADCSPDPIRGEPRTISISVPSLRVGTAAIRFTADPSAPPLGRLFLGWRFTGTEGAQRIGPESWISEASTGFEFHLPIGEIDLLTWSDEPLVLFERVVLRSGETTVLETRHP